MKKYYDEYYKNYYIDNKDKIKLNKNQICICDICNGNYTKSHKSHHEKSNKHQNNLNNLNK